jgi:hypothetical protein
MFIGTSVAPSIGGDNMENTLFFISSESANPKLNINKGSLSGYVKDTLMNPIKGVLVRLSFHDTYVENYTDSSGYYYLTEIPICFCLKNASATKSGYKTERVLLAIDENSTYDFVLTYSKELNGSLSGYVKDKSMNPIEGAMVKVFFHDTYEENYTNSSGYYNINNIPICFCLKNCTATKKGYKTEWVLLSIDENTTYDFVLTNNKSYILYLNDLQENKDFYIRFLERFPFLKRLAHPLSCYLFI